MGIITLLLFSVFLSPLVSAGPVIRVEIDQLEPLSIDADGQFQFSASLYDSSNATVSDTITWSASNGSIDSAGLFTPWASGNTTIFAYSNGFNDSVVINVSAGWPTSLSLTANLSQVQLGNGIQLTPSLTDSRGNSAVGHQISWSPSQGWVDSENVWFPSQVGSANIEVHWRELSDSVNLSATTGPASSLVLPLGLSVASGSSIELTPLIYDDWGNLLDNQSIGTLLWTAENGNINNGVFTAGQTGHWLITCSTSNGVSGKTNITVVSAEIDEIEIIIENRTFSADEAVELYVRVTDIYGNTEYITPPLSSWAIETGSLRIGENATEWIPGGEGNWTLELSHLGFVLSTDVGIIHGNAVEILLVTDESRISADDEATLYMQARDIRNNRWVVSGIWSMDNSTQDGFLSSFGTWALYEANLAGEWVIKGSWFDEQQQQFFNAEVILEVVPGRLASIILDGDESIITTDEIIDLNPHTFDEDGNPIANILMNWSVDETEQTTAFRLNRGVFYPDSIGLHEIRAFADGAFTSIVIEVTPGRARSIVIDIPNEVTISSGANGKIAFTATGLDLSNNSFSISQMTWAIPEGGVAISPGATNGEWMIEGIEAGVHDIELMSDDASFFLQVTVVAGDPARIDLTMGSDDLKQGDELLINVRVYDSHGNEVVVTPADLTASSTAGKITHVKDGSWLISLDEGGSDHAVTIRFQNITEQRFFDVQEALLGGFLGSTNTTVLAGTLVLAIALMMMIFVLKRSNKDEEQWVESKVEPVISKPEITTISVANDVPHSPLEVYTEVATNAYPSTSPIDDPYSQSAASASSTTPISPTPASLASTTALTTPNLATPVAQVAQVSAPVSMVDNAKTTAALEAAELAKSTGVMVAAEGTVQGESGWYYDSSGELTNWRVEQNGAWTRI